MVPVIEKKYMLHLRKQNWNPVKAKLSKCSVNAALYSHTGEGVNTFAPVLLYLYRYL